MTLRHTLVLVLAIALAACDKGPAAPQKGANAPAGQPLLLANEDVITIRTSALASGPVITGSVQPERRADLRAEVSAIVLHVLKENGDVVRRGDLLVRLDEGLPSASIGATPSRPRTSRTCR